MVAHLMRMKLALTVNGWRKSTFQLVMNILFIAYILFVLTMLAVGMWILASESTVEMRGTVLTFAGAVAVLGWVVIPVFLTGVDMTLDPANFLTFGIPTRRLVLGLAMAGLLTLAGAATLLGFLASTLAWRDEPLAMLLAAVTAVLGALFCLCISYAVTGLLAGFTGQRRIREIMMLLVFVPLMLAGVIVGGIVESVEMMLDQLPAIAAVIAWTPLGTFTAAPWAVAEGHYLTAGLQVVLCVVWLVGALWLWAVAVRRSYTHARGSGASGKSVAGVGLLGVFPGTPAGAIAARSLIYWLKDPRYSASLVVLPLMLVLFWFLGSQSGDHSMLLIMGPLTGFMLGYAISADISYDGSAFALHVTSGVSGTDDRRGRVFSLLLWATPVTVLFTVATTAMAGQWELLPGLLGVGVGVLLTGSGVSALVSARFIYPVPPPGASPFATPEGGTMRMMLVSFGAMAVVGVLALPEIILYAVALATGSMLLQWITLVVGLSLGAVLLWLGIRFGARWFERSQAETYQSVLAATG